MEAAEGIDQNAALAAQLRRSILGALVARAKGGTAQAYTTLVRDLAALKRRLEADPTDSEADFSLAALLRALTGCVSSLRERRHDALLAEVLGMRLWLLPQGVRAAQLEVLVNLMVANGAFLHNCLQAMLFSLLPPPGMAPTPDEPGAAWAPSERAVEVQDQVVGALEKALQLVPTLPTQLLPMLLQNLPHKTRDRASQCLYLRAVLALAERPAGAGLREGLLLGVVDHLLAIDVEVKWEDIVDVRTGQEAEEGSSEEEEDHEDIFELEGAVQEGIHDLDIHGGGVWAGGGRGGGQIGFDDGAGFGAPGAALCGRRGHTRVAHAAGRV